MKLTPMSNLGLHEDSYHLLLTHVFEGLKKPFGDNIAKAVFVLVSEGWFAQEGGHENGRGNGVV
jgi:hypothetical protein